MLGSGGFMTDLSFKGGLFAMNLVCIRHSLTKLISNTVSKGNQQFTFRNVTIENAVTVSSTTSEKKKKKKRKKLEAFGPKGLSVEWKISLHAY